MSQRSDPDPKRRLFAHPLIHFALIGACLFALRVGWLPPAREVLVVSAADRDALSRDWQKQTGRAANATELAAMIEGFIADELLHREAVGLGWNRSDPVVQRRLIQNQRFVEPGSDASDAQRLDAALSQGMDAGDLVVRRRLVERMRAVYRASGRAVEPSERELAAYLAEHPGEFASSARIELTHVFLSRDRRGAALAGDADRLRERLVAESATPELAASWGDAFLIPASLPLWSEERLASRFGSAFATRVVAAPARTWIGPVESSYGMHLVWIHAREEAGVPSLERVRERIREAWFRDREGVALRAGIAALRERFDVVIATGDLVAGSAAD